MSKLTPLKKAIADFVSDGDVLYAAGFTHLIPFAAGHEIIRQGKKNLTLARATPDLIYDQMVAAGCAKKVIFSYMGNPGVGSLRIVRAAIERGELEWGIFPLRNDHPPPGRRFGTPIFADEANRSRRSGEGESADQAHPRPVRRLRMSSSSRLSTLMLPSSMFSVRIKTETPINGESSASKKKPPSLRRKSS